MAGVSNIEWTEHTWNPIVGCSIVSPGCTNCYAMRMARRLELMSIGTPLAGRSYGNLTKVVNGNPVWTGALRFVERALTVPLKRKKPTTYFVNSMGDLFHEDCPDEWIDKVFAVMALSPQHTFQVLTKRAERMREYLTFRQLDRGFRTLEAMRNLAPPNDGENYRIHQESGALPNVWLGVSAERQQEADERIPLLLQTPAAVRFLSAEPLLGPINVEKFFHHPNWIHWIIVGGESGPRARPMNPQWARDIRDQCASFCVAFFHKQNGEFVSVSEVEGAGAHFNFPDGRTVRRVGKKAAGRLLDGVEWSEFPVTSQSRSEAA